MPVHRVVEKKTTTWASKGKPLSLARPRGPYPILICLGIWLALLVASLQVGAAPGHIKWTFSATNDVASRGFVKSDIFSSPAIGDDGTIYVKMFVLTSDGTQKNILYAVDPKTGQPKWGTDMAGTNAYSSPAIGIGGTVYAGSTNYAYSAFKGFNGQEKWGFPTLDPLVSCSAAIGPDASVYVGSNDSALYAREGDSGTPKWTNIASFYVLSSPAIGADGIIYYGDGGSFLYAAEQATGKIIWKIKSAGDSIQSSPAIGGDGTIYFGSVDKYLYAVNPKTLKTTWRYPTDGWVLSSPAVGPDGTVYVGSYDTKLYAIDGSTGKKLRTFQTGGIVYSSPAIGFDGTVYVGSQDFSLYAFNSQTGETNWSVPTGNVVNSSPTIGSDGTVYFGSWDGNLYAVEGNSTNGLANSPWPKFRHDTHNSGSLLPLTNIIHWITNDVVVTTLAGSGVAGSAGGVGTSAQFSSPNGGFVDGVGNVWVADAGNNSVRKVDTNGNVITITGNFNGPIGLCVDAAGTAYVAETGNDILMIGTHGVIPIAGSGQAGYSDGPARSAQFNFSNDLAIAADGTIYISEFNNHTIRKLSRDFTIVTTLVGNGNAGYQDGVGTNALLNRPGGIALDNQGDLFVTEWAGNRIRRIDTNGNVTTVAGSTNGVVGDAGYVDGVGTDARFNNPDGIVVDAAGNLYVTEHSNFSVRRITMPAGVVETVAGTGTIGFANGDGQLARFSDLTGVGTDNQGHLYVTEGSSNRVRQITIKAPPTILTQLHDATILVGQNPNFSVTATGLGPISYQWFRDGSPLDGFTANSLPISSATPNDSAQYSVQVFNRVGTNIVSATLKVLRPLNIPDPNQIFVAPVGMAYFLRVIHEGDATSYQWYKNDTLLTSETQEILSFNNLTLIDGATYRVEISNPFHTSTATGQLIVVAPPRIDSPPQSSTNLDGTTATFTVNATSVVSTNNTDPTLTPLGYQWLFNDVLIPGAINSSFTLSPVHTTDMGNYTVVVTNLATFNVNDPNFASSITSAPVSLTVYVPPNIILAPQTQSAFVGNPVTFNVTATGTAPLGYQWLTNGIAIPGATTNSYTIIRVSTNDAGQYSVVVSNIAAIIDPVAGIVPSLSANLTVYVHPSILVNPQAATVNQGETTNFFVIADGNPPLGYQWSMEGTALPGQTNSNLTITNAQSTDEGMYTVLVYDPITGDILPSSPAKLTVNVAPVITQQPQSVTNTVGSSAVFSVIATGAAPLWYQWYHNTNTVTDATNFLYTIDHTGMGDAGNFYVIVTNLAGSVTSDVVSLTLNVPPLITTQPADTTVVLSSNATFTVEAGGIPPVTYQWRFGTNAIAYGTNSTLILTNVQLADAGDYSVVVANSVDILNSGNAHLTVIVPPSIASTQLNLTVTNGGSLTFGVTASGTSPLSYQWFSGGTLNTNSATNSFTISNATTNDTGQYSVIVTNVAGSATGVVANVNVWVPPFITEQPTNTTVLLGTNATFIVGAGGVPELTYQWFLGTNIITFGTSGTLIITNVTRESVGDYSVVVSNRVSAVTSTKAHLAVYEPPTIQRQPQSLTVNLGAPFAFSIAAAGSTPLSYQWSHNGTQISSATNATFGIGGAQAADAGSYAVTVSNIAGSTNSIDAILTVNAGPAITAGFANLIVTNGGLVNFSISVTGTAPFTYQWSKNGVVTANFTTDTVTIPNATTNDAGLYSVIVNNVAGSAYAGVANVTVWLPPFITDQPTNTTVVLGADATFTVGAGGVPQPVYQWRLGTNNIGYGTDSTLVVSNVTRESVGDYSVVVTNSAGGVISTNAHLTIYEPPIVQTQPQSLTINLGAPALFSVGAAGAAPLSYQWAHNGTNITGATNNSLIIIATQTTDAGNYAVTVSNIAGSANSASALLAFNVVPTITSIFTNLTITNGGTINFSVSVSGDGTPPFSYQWSKDRVVNTNFTTDTVTIANATTNDAGLYSVSVNNVAGSANGEVANVTVLVPPSILVPPQDSTVNAGGTALFNVGVGGSSPFTYQWQKNGTNLAGATTPSLTITNVSLADADNYSVIVGNAAGLTNSPTALLTVIVAPSILTQPQDVTVIDGAFALLSVLANGSPPLNYQWQLNGADITNATKAVFTIPNAHTNNAGKYSVIIRNTAGSVTSQVARLTVYVPPVIVSDPQPKTVAQGAKATFSVAASGTAPLRYQWLKNGVVIRDATGNVLIFEPAQLTDAGNYSVIVSNRAGTATSQTVAMFVYGPPSVVVQPRDLAAVIGNPAAFAVTALGGGVLRYQWFYNGAPIPGATSNLLAIASAQPGDAGKYWVTVANDPGRVTSRVVTLTVNVPPSITSQPQSVTVTNGNPASFNVAATGTAPLAFQWLKNGAIVPGATSTVYAVSAAQPVDAGNYWVVVTNIAGGATSQVAQLTVYVPPGITVQPQDATIISGGTAAFNVSATGTEPLIYQWLKNGAAIVGATNNGFTIVGGQARDAGNYAVTVANAAGTATSRTAVLTVNVPPSITVQPQSATVTNGNPASFNVAVSGTPPLTLQWYRNGAIVPGAASNVFNIISAQPADAGNYWVVVTNVAGGATSQVAQLTVYVPPVITVQPQNATVISGGTAAFNVSATGTEPLVYQWLKNGAAIAGATNGGLTIVGAQARDAGNYAVTVANAAGSVTSRVAVLTVNVPPSITVQPRNATVTNGGLASFSVGVAGTSPLTLQWYKNGVIVPGAASEAFNIVGAKPSDAGSYTVVVTNLAGSVTSQVAKLTVLVPPAITLQPQGVTIVQGSNATFRVSATGTTPLSYRWLKDGIGFANATGTSLAITNAQATDAGNYSVVVFNIAGTVQSQPALLTVNVRPVITTPPKNLKVEQGATATFTVEANGTQPLSYQWYKGQDLLVNATNATLVLSNVQMNDDGQYLVYVSNVADHVFAFATLTVTNSVKVNTAPVLTVPPAQTVTALNLMIVTNTATDADRPPNTLVFSLVSAPAGVRLDPESGVLTWTPTAAQAPSTIVITVRVTDNGTPPLSDTKSFTVVTVYAPASLRGVATDALNKQPLTGVTVRFGDRSQTTGPDGAFVFTNLPPGRLQADFTATPTSGLAPLSVQFTNTSTDNSYTLEAEKTGYSLYSYTPIELAPGEDKEWNFSLSPSLQGLRLVLNWGRLPLDLDAHLLTPKIDGINYHIQYTSRYFGQTNRPPFAQLDTDATEGYGPETITIFSNVPGIYRYYVHNYKADQGDTGELTVSAGVVQIYSTAGLIQTVTVPTTGVGDYWDVCAIDGVSGKITVLNQIVTNAPPPDSGGTGPSGGGGPPTQPTFAWDFGDGQTSAIENPAHTYSSPEAYTVSLRITLPDGRGSSITQAQYIVVSGPTTGTTPPKLTVTWTAKDFVITWQSDDPGYVLEYRTSLVSGEWTPVTPAPPPGPGNVYTVRIAATEAQYYFRLRK